MLALIRSLKKRIEILENELEDFKEQSNQNFLDLEAIRVEQDEARGTGESIHRNIGDLWKAIEKIEEHHPVQ